MSRSAVRSFAVSAVAAILLLGGLPPGSARPVAAYTVDPATVWINEIHYDNDGADQGEFVEIAGPAGTTLTGWQLVPYNGSGGASYSPIVNLAGVIPDQQNGYGTLSFAIPGLQNGSPDGIALANGSTLIQFLSYEGSFTASNGVANGQTSTDIGVSENGSQPVGVSLQLQGSGNTYQEFTWSTPIPNTQNGVNTGQTFVGDAEDSAPSVASTTPADNATNVPVDADISITFSELVDVTGTWFSISCTTSGAHSASVTGGSTTFMLDPDSNFSNEETCTVTIEADLVSDQDATDPPNSMVDDHSFAFTTVAADPCAGSYTPIFEIQGDDAASDHQNMVRTTEGVVTGDFEATDGSGLSGFFLQDADGDENASTSDGIFVFLPAANPLSTEVDVSVGDLVRLTGTVKEFNTLTELDNLTELFECGTGTVAATTVDLPEEMNGDLERYEGMLITIPETLTVSQNFFLGRYGQLHLSSEGRMYNPTNSNDAGSPAAIAQADLNARRQIILDDGRSGQNPDPVPYLVEGDPTTDSDDTLRAGDTTTGVTGNLDFGPISSTTGVRDYRIQPTATPTFTRMNPRTSNPEDVGGNVKVASFNVLNYFNGDGQGGGFPTSRGANTLAEFQRQRDKTIAAITAMDADVVGLIEMENDGEDANSAIQDLVNGLNEEEGASTYAIVPQPAGDLGGDEIKVAFIYQPSRVSLVGASSAATDAVFDRWPVAQTFDLPNGERFTAVVNHFKSKGCGDATGADLDQGDGQGCYNARRVQQAEALLDFIDGLQAASGDDDVLVIGDLNAYGAEDPIQLLEQDPSDQLGDGAGGLIDQLDLHVEGEPYSYVFDGQSGYLDHALTTASLSDDVSDATEWHINADEPSILDYNVEFKPDDRYAPTPYRSSDHDPVVIGLDLVAPPQEPEFSWVPPTRPRPARNEVTAGKTVLVKFTLGGNFGLGIFKDGWPRSQRYDCRTGEFIPGSQYRTRPYGSAGLVYNPTTEIYTYKWKTREEWGRPGFNCRQFQVKFDYDTTTIQRADYKLRLPPG